MLKLKKILMRCADSPDIGGKNFFSYDICVDSFLHTLHTCKVKHKSNNLKNISIAVSTKQINVKDISLRETMSSPDAKHLNMIALRFFLLFFAAICMEVVHTEYVVTITSQSTHC